jgi:hypothetical protein
MSRQKKKSIASIDHFCFDIIDIWYSISTSFSMMNFIYDLLTINWLRQNLLFYFLCMNKSMTKTAIWFYYLDSIVNVCALAKICHSFFSLFLLCVLITSLLECNELEAFIRFSIHHRSIHLFTYLLILFRPTSLSFL